MTNLAAVAFSLSPPLQGLLCIRALMGGGPSRDLPALVRQVALPAPRGNVWASSMLNAAEHTFRQLQLTSAQGLLEPGLQHELACKAVTFPLLTSVLTAYAQERCKQQLQVGAVLILCRIAVYSGNKTLLDHSLALARQADALSHISKKIAEVPFPPSWLTTQPSWLRTHITSLAQAASSTATTKPAPAAPPPDRIVPVHAAHIHLSLHRDASPKGQHKHRWCEATGLFTLQGSIEAPGAHNYSFAHVFRQLPLAQGGRIPMGAGISLALAPELMERLRQLRDLTEESGHCRLISAYSLPLLEEYSTGMCMSTDESWQQWAARIAQAQSCPCDAPAKLQATLRDYQHAGFQWMRRLSHWAGGACLADDMGLGKTVQSLALLLDMLPADTQEDAPNKGDPSLIVAPTSVCANWEQEIHIFAPSLTAHRLPAKNREAYLQNLKAGDVLIVSYGLLTSLQNSLSEIFWQVIIFDEAQALKNATAKRSKASRHLQASFRLALTGTPIENNLLEVWSIFSTITPGLLGSQEHFQQHFLQPDADASQAPSNPCHKLKARLQPFLLRRLKEEVLKELPPRTDQNLLVTLSPGEMAAYRNLQQQALHELQAMPTLNLPPQQGRMHILAQLTRLRQACCHPALLHKDSPLPSAKLDYCLDLLDTLHSAGHRALVFSQFVGFLQLLRAALDQKGTPYQYLDGATPEKQRQERVRAFQAGTGSLFLISLKAGGQGLNLTGADYVIHLDPWWNPAVEDQASDRAHRMGQSRPVTVYRLIAAHTVEENILTLHQQKRDLANNLLEGTDIVPHYSEAQLMELISHNYGEHPLEY